MSLSGTGAGSGAGSSSGAGAGSGAGSRAGESRTSIPPPSLGRRMVGRYEVIHPLAMGGMASIHVGRLSGMAGFERLVAIKTIHPHLAVQPEFVKMFLDEARVAARIHHPNVGEILEIGEDDGLLFMIGELIQGQDLRGIFRRTAQSGREISHGMCAHICSQVCLALQAAHSLRDPETGPLHIIHRDVSPRNVLISYDGFVKLIDFGVASARGKISQTETDGLKGKIAYMSPEQLRGHGIDRRSDIFSLGVVLYQMVTGAHPFPGDNDAARAQRVLHGDVVPPRRINPRTRPEMEAIISRAMARDRVERYRDAATMGRDLEEYARRSGERVGVGVLAELMTGVFKDKIADHEIRIRNYRKATDEPTGLQAAITRRTGALPAVLGDVEGDTDAGTPSALRRWADTTPKAPRPAGLDRRLLLAGGGAAAVLAGLIALLVVLVGGEKQPEEPTPAEAEDLVVAATDPTEDPAPAAGDEAADPEPPAAPAEVTISLSISPPRAEVTLDDRRVSVEDGVLVLPANGATRRIEASLEGYRSHGEQVVADMDREVSITLERLPSKPKPPIVEEEPGPVKPPAAPGPKRPARTRPAKKKADDPGLWDSPFS